MKLDKKNTLKSSNNDDWFDDTFSFLNTYHLLYVCMYVIVEVMQKTTTKQLNFIMSSSSSSSTSSFK